MYEKLYVSMTNVKLLRPCVVQSGKNVVIEKVYFVEK